MEAQELGSSVIFDITVRNIGESPVVVDSCEAVVRFTYVIPEDDQGDHPTQFDHRVEVVTEEDMLRIDPGEMATVSVVVHWEVLEGTSRMLSVNQAHFVVRYDASFGIVTAPITFMMATDELANRILPDDESAEEIRDLLRRFPGQASKRVEQLMHNLSD